MSTFYGPVQTAAHDPGALFLDAGRLFGPGKGLVVAAGIVDTLAVFVLSAPLGVAVATLCAGLPDGGLPLFLPGFAGQSLKLLDASGAEQALPADTATPERSSAISIFSAGTPTTRRQRLP